MNRPRLLASRFDPSGNAVSTVGCQGLAGPALRNLSSSRFLQTAGARRRGRAGARRRVTVVTESQGPTESARAA